VITNLLRALPYFGHSLVLWLWGGFSVDNSTLTRFFTLHFLLPFIVSGLSAMHIFYLHSTGSNNPLGLHAKADMVPFHCYYRYKDVFGFVILLSCLFFIVFFFPNLFFEPANFSPANPIVTPSHIVPEWYFLFAYAILRTITSKFGGVFGMASSILVLLTLPFSHSQVIKGLCFYGIVKFLYWVHIVSFCTLTTAGSWPIAVPYIQVSIYSAVTYFSFYFLLPVYRLCWDKIIF